MNDAFSHLDECAAIIPADTGRNITLNGVDDQSPQASSLP
jgi:hypothetical protein